MKGYLGSKAGSGVYQAIIALMPPHDTYVELFAGSGAVLTRKPPCPISYAVDMDRDALWRIPKVPGMVRWHGDAMKFLDEIDWAAAGRVLIYADPPYLHSTRTSKHRYEHELSDEDHFALLQRLMLCPAQVILSGYPSEMYDSMLSGWRSREFQAMTRGGVRTEKLWFNFEPTAVHYATFAGTDYTDRQRIKRKAARWAQMYAALPPGERMAVLTALLSVESPASQTPPALHDRPEQSRLPMLEVPVLTKPGSGVLYVGKKPNQIRIYETVSTDANDCAGDRTAAQMPVQSQRAGSSNSPQVTSNLRSGVESDA